MTMKNEVLKNIVAREHAEKISISFFCNNVSSEDYCLLIPISKFAFFFHFLFAN